MYRDFSNNKKCHTIVVTGKIEFKDLEPYLYKENGNDSFCPEDVNLYHPGEECEGFPGSEDHNLCELEEGDFEPTDSIGSFPAKTLLARFKAAHAKKWPSKFKLMQMEG